MRDDHALTQTPTALATGSLAGAGAADAAIATAALEALRRRLRALHGCRSRSGPRRRRRAGGAR